MSGGVCRGVVGTVRGALVFERCSHLTVILFRAMPAKICVAGGERDRVERVSETRSGPSTCAWQVDVCERV